MSIVVQMWKGTGYDKDVRLKKYLLGDGTTHYEFRNRFGSPSNPDPKEVAKIIKLWGLVEVDLNR